MVGLNIEIAQHQSQQMQLSPQILQSLSLLSMNSQELSTQIYEESQKNPAIEIISDSKPSIKPVSAKKSFNENLPQKIPTSTGILESDNFQSFLENRPAFGKSLQEHLLDQFRLVAETPEILELGKKIISNLDTRGFNQEIPEKLLNPACKEETPELLEKCLKIIQHLEPVGCAVSGPEESLLIQAKSFPNPPSLALFILKGKLNLLEKPRINLVTKKLAELTEKTKEEPPVPITEKNVSDALDFIKTLDPNPARQFSLKETQYISPDVYIKKIQNEEENGFQLQVELVRYDIPEIALSPIYKELATSLDSSSPKEKKDLKYIKEAVKDAEWFINAIRYRESSIFKVALAISDLQHNFFLKGPLYLKPIRMKDVAEKIGIHEATVSRISNGKYIQCDWGLFEIKYFFSAKVTSSTVTSSEQNISDSNNSVSRESVKLVLKDIILKHKEDNPEAKPLSDQKLAEKLKEKGIQVARRTVAKYRTELEINSSFDRK